MYSLIYCCTLPSSVGFNERSLTRSPFFPWSLQSPPPPDPLPLSLLSSRTPCTLVMTERNRELEKENIKNSPTFLPPQRLYFPLINVSPPPTPASLCSLKKNMYRERERGEKKLFPNFTLILIFTTISLRFKFFLRRFVNHFTKTVVSEFFILL